MKFAAVLFLAVTLTVVIAKPRPRDNVRSVRSVTDDVTCGPLGAPTGGYTNLNTSLMFPKATCAEWKDYSNSTSGLYFISPIGGCEFKVYCDMCVMNREGWIVIQRRRSSDVAFQNKNWEDYRTGFGSYLGNYWMGLEKIHEITSSGDYELFIGFRYFEQYYDERYALYDNFAVGSEADYYKLTVSGYSTGSTAVDSLQMHDGQSFSTYDEDHDGLGGGIDCANLFGERHGGWWFGGGSTGNNNDLVSCVSSNLNGQYYTYGQSASSNRITWYDLNLPLNLLVEETLMAIRRI